MQVYQDDLQIKLAFCTSLTIFYGIINLVQPVGVYVFLCNTIHTFIHFVYFDLNFECATYQKSGPSRVVPGHSKNFRFYGGQSRKIDKKIIQKSYMNGILYRMKFGMKVSKKYRKLHFQLASITHNNIFFFR